MTMAVTDVPRAMGEQSLIGNTGRRNALQFISDTWSSLAFKKVMDDRDNRIIPPWVGAHWRRLTAYKLLTAIYQNRARAFLAIEDEDAKAEHREYGDAALIVDTVRSAVTGDDVSIVIADMDEKDKEAQERLEWLEEWAAKERLIEAVMDAELDAPKLGDAVYVVWGDTDKERPRVEVYDPGFYFPYLDPNEPQSDFPKRIDIAWEYEEDHGDGTKTRWIRRKTWELGPIVPIEEGGLFSGEVLRLGDKRDPLSGSITRNYLWNDKPSRLTCYFTDGHWQIDRLPEHATMDNPKAWGKAQKYEEYAGADVLLLDLEKDHIPVIHIPNTPTRKEHFGESILLRTAQTLDELAVADSDAAKAAELAGTPMVVASGTEAKNMRVKAGAVIGVAPGGRMDQLDLSSSLTAIMAYREELKDRVVVNTRLTNEALGRVKAENIKSGLHMALSWGPMRSMVESLRLTRNGQYPILLRFVQREALAQGWITGKVQPATLAFGSFLPSDKAAVVELAKSLFETHLISRETAVRMLVDEGVIDVDVADELQACEREDFESALALFEALGGGDDAADQVWELLGKERPEPSNTPEGSNTLPSNTTGVQVDPETGAPVLNLSNRTRPEEQP